MIEEEIPDKHIFMMCESLNKHALSELSDEFIVRSCRKDEFSIWKSFPFDNAKDAKEYDPFMLEFFNATYIGKEEEFYKKTLFVCDKNDKPIATCMIWKAYGEFNTIHWFKVLKEAEGKGIGRALFSIIMSNLKNDDYPIYLHTHPIGFRAIKLYSDFGFNILTDKKIGLRQNEIEESLPILERFMHQKDFRNLKFKEAPKYFIDRLKDFPSNQF